MPYWNKYACSSSFFCKKNISSSSGGGGGGGEQHTMKVGYQGTTENSHTGHCTHTHTSESNDVKVQNIQHGK